MMWWLNKISLIFNVINESIFITWNFNIVYKFSIVVDLNICNNFLFIITFNL